MFDCLSCWLPITAHQVICSSPLPLFPRLVEFDDCASNQDIRYRSSDPDFKVGSNGTLYATHTLHVPTDQVKFIVTARNVKTQEKWETVVKLHVKAPGSSIHNDNKVFALPLPKTSQRA